MNLVEKIVNKLNGLHYPQEYLCFSSESFERPLHAYLINNSKVIKDITSLHSFVGYCPLVFALPSSAIPYAAPETIIIAFTQKAFSLNEFLSKKDAIALLSLKKIKEQPTTNELVVYYEGLKGQHRFVSSFHQLIIQLHNHFYHNKPGNIFLKGNMYKQVQIAYSIPRNIALITVGQYDKFNLFPTDLHGPIGNGYYIISLRHEGKACQQVTDTRRLLLTQVDSSFYKTAYSLGKNHMQPPKSNNNFPFDNQLSEHLKLPLPQSALFYSELELKDTFICGIHRIMLLKILYQQGLQQNPATLSHIHNVYATWRYNNQLSGNYLFR